MSQRVLITAGASGIGKEIASAYAAIGAQVCVCDINEKSLDTAAKEIPGLKTIVCDVSKRDDIERMVAASVEALGRARCAGQQRRASQGRRRPSRTRIPTNGKRS